MRTHQLDKKIKEKVAFLRNNDHPDMLYGVQAMAQMFGVHENTIRNWRKAGKIRAIKDIEGVRGFVYRSGDVLEDIEKLCNGKE